jgi:GT2 family glycosyltransferase
VTTGPSVSVILCVKDGGDLLRVQLDALAAQDAGVDWELLVVDNGSTDDTAQRVRSWFAARPDVAGQLIDGSARRGLAAARNVGAATSTRELLLFCDADDEADPRWVQALSDALATAPLVAGRLELGRLNSRRLLNQRKHVLPSNPGLAYGQAFAVGANFGIRRDVFQEVGGCDERLIGAGEDLDLSLRVQALGHPLGLAPLAVMHYRMRPETKSYLRQQYRYGQAAGLLLEEYRTTATELTGDSALAWLARHLPRAVAKPTGPSAFELRQRIAYRRGVWSHRKRMQDRAVDPAALARFDLVTELELSCTEPLPLPDTLVDARVLVRLHGAPLGFVAVTGQGLLARQEVLQAGGAPLREALERHLTLDGITSSDDAAADLPCRRRGDADSVPTVSIIIGTRDRPDHLRAALTSILACRGTFDVVVVDNGPSTEATRTLVGGLADDRLRYVRIPQPGLSRARNVGAAESTGEVLVFTDDDVRADTGWIEGMVRAFTAEPNVGLVTGMVAAAELSTEAQVFFDQRVSWSRRCEPASFRLPAGRRDPLFPFRGGDLGTGANMALTRRAFASLGGFDLALGPGTPARGGEDLDLFARAMLAGYVVRYEPTALLWHTHRREVSDLHSQIRGYGSGLTAYLMKHALTRVGSGRLLRGLTSGASRMSHQHREASRAQLGTDMIRQERLGLMEGPLLYLRGRRHNSS